MPKWFALLPFPTVLKHLAGSAWNMAGRLFAMGAVAGFGLSVYVGALSAIDSVFESRDNWYQEGKLADLEVRVVTDDMVNFPEFNDIEGVQDSRTRMIYPGFLETDDTADSQRLRTIVIAAVQGADSAINVQTLMQGQALDPVDRYGAVIERSLARYHNKKVGDQLNLVFGTDKVELTVRGIVFDPEFLLSPSNPSLFVPSKGSLGVIYANPGILEDRFGFTPANSLLLAVEPGADVEAIRTQVLERAQTRLNVERSASREEQFSYQFLEKDLGVFRIVVPVIVLVSVISSIFVTVILFMRWVTDEKKALGVFLAMGHRPSSIALSFAAMYLYLVSGVVLGGLLFAGFVGKSFLANFSGAIGLPDPVFSFQPFYVYTGILGVILIFALSGLFAVNKVFKLSARDAMRNTQAEAGVPGKIGTAAANFMPTSWLRFPVRSLFRNAIMSLSTIAAIALGFGITAAFFIAFSSFVGTSVKRVEQNTWNAAVDFVAPVWEESYQELINEMELDDVSMYTKSVVQAVKDSQRINLYVGGFEPEKRWHQVELVAGEYLSASEPQGILLERNTADELKLSLGDELELQMQGRSRVAKVRGLFSGAMPGEARMTLEFHREIADLQERATGMFIQTAGNTGEIMRQLRKNRDVQQVLTPESVADEIISASGQVTGIIRLGSFISMAIAALLAFACVGYTVLRRHDEYQMLRLVGYQDRFITLIVVVEIALLAIIAMIVAIPVGALTAEYLNNKLSAAWFEIDTIVTLFDYLKTFIPGLLLLPVLALPIAYMVFTNSTGNRPASEDDFVIFSAIAKQLVRLSFVVLLTSFSLVALADADARAIMEKVDQAERPEYEFGKLKMQLLDSGADPIERELVWRFTHKDGERRSLLKFLEPSSVRDVGILVVEQSGEDNAIWHYLPATRNVRRISSSHRQNRFMGTEYVFEDFEGLKLEKYEYELLRTEPCPTGDTCQVILAKAVDAEEAETSSYSSKQYWVDDEKSVIVRIEFYADDGELVKVLETGNLRDVNGFWRAQDQTLSNKRNGRTTTLTDMERVINEPFDDYYVKQRYLRSD